MSEKFAMFVFCTGLVVVMFGVGLVEGSITNSELAIGVLVSFLGCGTMWAVIPTLSDC